MSYTVPTLEPSKLQAGDTLRFDKSLAEFPASEGWALSYVLISGLPTVEKVVIAATTASNGSDFEINVDSATTSAWTPGDYKLVGYVTNSPDRYQVYSGDFTVTPDLVNEELGYNDGRSYYEKILDQVREVISTGVIREVIRYSFNGVSTEVMSLADALKAESWLVGKVEQEKFKTSGRQRKILTRFVRPS